MARRGGKAAARRARQRTAHRGAMRRPVSPVAPTPLPPRGAPNVEPATEALQAQRQPAVPATASGPSGLSERARTEYHYVGRDLRNIAILGALMALLLVGAWLFFPILGLTAG